MQTYDNVYVLVFACISFLILSRFDTKVNQDVLSILPEKRLKLVVESM